MISNNIRIIREKISAAAKKTGRSGNDIAVVGVTKGVSAEKIIEAVDNGIRYIGESKIQEAEQKIPSIIKYAESKGVNLGFHMVGHLQTNKARKALRMFDLIQSVDSLNLVEKINELSLEANKNTGILIEVNTSGESSKFGVAVEDVLSFLMKIIKFEGIRVKGLMTMAPYMEDNEKTRPCFSSLRSLRDNINKIMLPEFRNNISMDYLSMGMSDDYEIAVQEGANMVRIGRAIFGDYV